MIVITFLFFAKHCKAGLGGQRFSKQRNNIFLFSYHFIFNYLSIKRLNYK